MGQRLYQLTIEGTLELHPLADEEIKEGDVYGQRVTVRLDEERKQYAPVTLFNEGESISIDDSYGHAVKISMELWQHHLMGMFG